MINETKDAYEDTMKKQKAKIKTMIEGVEVQIEELNLDNEDFKESLEEAGAGNDDILERLKTLEMRETIVKKQMQKMSDINVARNA